MKPRSAHIRIGWILLSVFLIGVVPVSAGATSGEDRAVCDVVVVEPVAAPVAGQDLELRITFPADCSPESGTLFYRPTASAAFQSTPLFLTASPVTAFIPAAGVNHRGMDYYLSLVIDGSPLTVPAANPEGNPIRLRVQVERLDADISLPVLQYRMVSVPFELDDPAIAAVLEDDYGIYDPDDWRLLRWNPAKAAYDEHPDIQAAFTPGTACWLNTRSGKGFDIEGGRSVRATTTYALTLEPGWNQIATPFAFPVAWESIVGIDQVQAPVAYDGAEYQYQQGVLRPWQGYFVFNPTATTVTLAVPPVEAAASAFPKHTDAFPFLASAAYAVQLGATLPGYDLADTHNYIGMAETEAVEVAEAPGIGGHLRLSVMAGGERLAGSFRPQVSDGQQWDLEVEAVLPDEVLPVRKQVQVRLTEHGVRPPGFTLYVVDLDEGRMLAVEEGVFELSVSPSKPVHRLRVMVGTAAYVEAQGEGVPLEVFKDALMPNYPNPFNTATRIRYTLRRRGTVMLSVYDMLGRRVRVLVYGEQDAGVHEAVWDGQDEARSPVATGIYFYQLETNEYKAVQKMVLMR